MADINKEKRISMWCAFVIFLVTIPLFNYFDNRQLIEDDLTTIDNLILSSNSQYDPGGGKGSTHSIKFEFTNTERGFKLANEEFSCITKNTILSNFKKGDTVSIKIDKSDVIKFNTVNWFNKFTPLYGLSKHGQSYISLKCRNELSSQWTKAAIIASLTSATIAFFLAFFFLKPKTKYQTFSQIPIHPTIIVALAWLICYITLR